MVNSQRIWFDPIQISTRIALRKALRGCDFVLDVGCGSVSPLREFGIKHLTGIEGHRETFDVAARGDVYERLIHGDIRELNRFFSSGQFDACVALDVIEHLPKEDGLHLLRDMTEIAKKTIVIFTPMGFLPQRHQSSDDLQEHLSGWEPSEMESFGFRVSGMLGPKLLRGEHHRLIYRPKFFWAVVSLLAQFCWTRHHPSAAAAILCVKSKG